MPSLAELLAGAGQSPLGAIGRQPYVAQNPADTLGAIGAPVAQGIAGMFGGPSWLDQARAQTNKDKAAFQSGGVPALMGDTAATADLAGGFGGVTRDPKLWHGLSQIKLPKPVSEMSATHVPTGKAVETSLDPASLQGGWLLPALGDRSATGSNLTGYNGYKFENPVPMQGGHGFMAENSDAGAVWASGEGVAKRIAKNAAKLGADGTPVYFPYTAMGERSVDFSHHVSSSLAEAIKHERNIPVPAQEAFDAVIRDTKMKDFKPVPDWPGVSSPGLDEFLLNSPGEVRNKFAKVMDTAKFRKEGFPSVAEARHAVTDPRLLDAPTGAAGLSVSRLDPSGNVLKDVSGHKTYNADLGGEYIGGLGRSVPKEVMYPDLIKSYEQFGFRPDQYDYLMARGKKGAPIAQKANQQWLDGIMQWIAANPKDAMKYGIAPMGGTAALSQLQPEPQQ